MYHLIPFENSTTFFCDNKALIRVRHAGYVHILLFHSPALRLAEYALVRKAVDKAFAAGGFYENLERLVKDIRFDVKLDNGAVVRLNASWKPLKGAIAPAWVGLLVYRNFDDSTTFTAEIRYFDSVPTDLVKRGFVRVNDAISDPSREAKPNVQINTALLVQHKSIVDGGDSPDDRAKKGEGFHSAIKRFAARLFNKLF